MNPNLRAFERTVSIVKAVLTDAEAKHELSDTAKLWIEQLKDAVYDADDLLDEFLTLAQQKQLVKGGKVSKKVRLFFSRYNYLLVAYDMSREVKKIREKLDAIADDRIQLGLSIVIDNKPIRRRREETCSYAYATDIIGREEDTEKIVALLLDSSAQRDVSFLPIVGIGGLGKTTLAQLVYNHEKVKQEFDLRLWACVFDQDPKHLDVKMVLDKILESATGDKPDGSSMDKVQGQLRQRLGGKKYLLVLDDVGIEARDEWLKLVGFLMGGMRRSWIMVTTRSKRTAEIVGNGHEYELQGLSEEDSWRLFERAAFGPGQEQTNTLNLIEIGQEVVKKCRNVPLAIKVLGTLLHGQEKRKWLAFREIGFAGIGRGENDVLSILKFSYDNLESPLKSCFSFCALFPKDFVIRKEKLISLWMAHGYIVALDEGQSMEDVAEEYFTILLRRCFFQDVEKDLFGEIFRFKIHDLLHDIAQGVAGNEICLVDSIPTNLDKRIRHLSLTGGNSTEGYFPKSKIRTHFYCCGPCGVTGVLSHVGQLLGNWKCLRALDLRACLKDKGLPISIGELMHLRYLDLSGNSELEALPESITKLYNLQTLDLYWCYSLKELPKKLGKLVNLRFLGLDGCNGLKRMPLDLGKLTSLHWLTKFAVDGQISSSKLCIVDQLENLKALMNLSGHLRIQIYGEVGKVKGKEREGGYLSSKERLSSIDVVFGENRDMWYNEDNDNDREGDDEEMVMEDLKPHPNLKGLRLEGYMGGRMPRWAREDNLATCLPNLVHIDLYFCKRVQYLPSLGKLRHLESLVIQRLDELEYMEEGEEDTSVSVLGAEEESSSLFPSLVDLRLVSLPKWKGWWRGGGGVGAADNIRGGGGNNRHPPPPRSLWPSFPCLSHLAIRSCDNLTSVPVVVSKGGGTAPLFKLRALEVDHSGYLKLLPMEAVHNLTEMKIKEDFSLESMSEVEEVLRASSSSLRSLEIHDCKKLRSLSGGLEHLTGLETLRIYEAWNLSEVEDGIMQPWRSLCHCLRSLTLHNVSDLPKGIQYLTSLHYLTLYHLTDLVNLPEWMHGLTSLRSLVIRTAQHWNRCQNSCRNSPDLSF